MSFVSLLTIVGVIAAIITLVIAMVYKKHKRWLISYLQNFCGILFIISGAVKAVDPLGTAYKMEQYFEQFAVHFDHGIWKVFVPLFPALLKLALPFAIAMIVAEIVLGIMLIIGAANKWTSKAFLAIIVLFTILTGFTYLTGYVPSGSSFFDFGSWGDYNVKQRLVTDCGCFGDFIKLDPGVSFLKDVVLLVPAFIFLFFHKSMHKLFTRPWRIGITVLSLILVTAYCYYYSHTTLPNYDFRPFHNGADIRTQKSLEEEALSNVEVIKYKMKNKLSKKVVELDPDVYMKEFAQYPKEEWSMSVEETEPEVKQTKISEFVIFNKDFDDISGDILANKDINYWVVCPKIKYHDYEEKVAIVRDTTWRMDTTAINLDYSIEMIRVVDSIEEREVEDYIYNWDDKFLNRLRTKVLPLVERMEQQGKKVYMMMGNIDEYSQKDLERNLGRSLPIYTADEILLKTIIRSNPGFVKMEDGKIIEKFHYNDFDPDKD